MSLDARSGKKIIKIQIVESRKKKRQGRISKKSSF